MKQLTRLTIIAAIWPLLGTAQITANELRDVLQQPGRKLILVDIRLPERYQAGTIPGAINIPAAVIVEKRLAYPVPLVLFDSGLDGRRPASLVSAMLAKGVAGVDWLVGGLAAWQELGTVNTSAGQGASPVQRAFISYDQLRDSSDSACMIDLRPTDTQQQHKDANPCPLRNFCARQGYSYCPDIADFHLRNSGRAVRENAGLGPLVVLVDDDRKTASDVQRRLRAEGYRRVVILLGGTDIIVREGRRGIARAGGYTQTFTGSTIRSSQKADQPSHSSDSPAPQDSP
jgi:rhodanese-related sulfurtransferase